MVSSFSNTFLKRTWLIIYLKRLRAVCFKASRRLAMRLTYGSLKPSAGATVSERWLAAEIQLIKGKHICLCMLDLHIKTHGLVQEMWKTLVGICSLNLQSWLTVRILSRRKVSESDLFFKISKEVKLYICPNKISLNMAC